MTAKTFTDHDVKVTICGIIRNIWGDAIQNNSPEYITPEVVQIVDDVVKKIRNCSKRLVEYDQTFQFFYAGIPGTLWEMIVSLALGMIAEGLYGDKHNPLGTFVGWFDVMRGKREYIACINTAAVHNRSRLEIALLGL